MGKIKSIRYISLIFQFAFFCPIECLFVVGVGLFFIFYTL